MTFDELKNLDPKQIGSWPTLAKGLVLLLIAVVILAAGGWLGWYPQYEELTKKEADEEKFKKAYVDKKAQAINLDLYSNQLRDIEVQFGTLLKQLPSKSEMDGLLSDINQAGIGRGLQFELFKPAANEKFTEFYAELPVSIKVSGTYHDFGAFASDVAQMPRIVTLNDLAIAATKDGSLTMDATARTFRYLDDEEVAKQRKDAADAKKKAGK